MPTRRSPFVVALCLGAVGCAGERPPSEQATATAAETPDSLLGCYVFRWMPRGALDSGPRLPDGVRLDELAAEDYELESHEHTAAEQRARAERGIVRRAVRLGADGQAVPSGMNALARAHPIWWVSTRDESLHVAFLGSLGTTDVVLGPSGSAARDTLAGHVFDTTQYGPPFRTDRGKVLAVRQPCRAMLDGASAGAGAPAS